MEEVLSNKRKEEEKRRWLEELDQQRKETSERKRREKLLQRQVQQRHSKNHRQVQQRHSGFTVTCVSLQTEDHELWATHFDSLQRRPPVAAAPSAPPAPPVPSAVSERGEWEPSSSLSLWEAMSSCGAESVGGASEDTSSRYPTRARYDGSVNVEKEIFCQFMELCL